MKPPAISILITALLASQLSADVGLFEIGHPEKATIPAFNAPQIELTAYVSRYPEEGHADYSEREEADEGNPDGHTVTYYKDRRMTWYGEPGGTFVSRFTLTWDGREIKIPDGYWNDLDRLRIDLVKQTREPESEEEERELVHAHRSHDGPLVELSGDGKSVLITWIRREDGDTSSIFRWMIASDGTVLRHHEESPGI